MHLVLILTTILAAASARAQTCEDLFQTEPVEAASAGMAGPGLPEFRLSGTQIRLGENTPALKDRVATLTAAARFLELSDGDLSRIIAVVAAAKKSQTSTLEKIETIEKILRTSNIETLAIKTITDILWKIDLYQRPKFSDQIEKLAESDLHNFIKRRLETDNRTTAADFIAQHPKVMIPFLAASYQAMLQIVTRPGFRRTSVAESKKTRALSQQDFISMLAVARRVHTVINEAIARPNPPQTFEAWLPVFASGLEPSAAPYLIKNVVGMLTGAGLAATARQVTNRHTHLDIPRSNFIWGWEFGMVQVLNVYARYPLEFRETTDPIESARPLTSTEVDSYVAMATPDKAGPSFQFLKEATLLSLGMGRLNTLSSNELRQRVRSSLEEVARPIREAILEEQHRQKAALPAPARPVGVWTTPGLPASAGRGDRVAQVPGRLLRPEKAETPPVAQQVNQEIAAPKEPLLNGVNRQNPLQPGVRYAFRRDKMKEYNYVEVSAEVISEIQRLHENVEDWVAAFLKGPAAKVGDTGTKVMVSARGYVLEIKPSLVTPMRILVVHDKVQKLWIWKYHLDKQDMDRRVRNLKL